MCSPCYFSSSLIGRIYEIGYNNDMPMRSKQKNIPLYDYPLLKLFINSVALLIVFTLVRMYFTINDWMDLRYFSHRDWIIKDIGTALAMVGMAGGLYIGVQTWFAIRYTRDKSKTIRYGVIALLVGVSVAFAVIGTHSSIDHITDETRTVLRK